MHLTFPLPSRFCKLCLYAPSAFLVLPAGQLISPSHHSSCPSVFLPCLCYFFPEMWRVGLQMVLEMRAQEGFARRQNGALCLALLPFWVQKTNCIIGVLGLAEMELVLPTAALVVLCSVLVARTVLITHQCFGYC